MNQIAPAIRPAVRVRHETRLRLLQVARVEDLSPLMRRVTLTGDDLPGFTSAAADDHVKLIFPTHGQDRPILPALSADPASPRPPMRDYTPRRYDPATNELTLEFVLHGDGPAATWATQAASGQWLGVGGPRGSWLTPTDCDAYLLAGDETALPAIARFLEEMRPGAEAHVFIEVATSAEQRHLATAAHAAITWLPRNGIHPGKATLLQQALADFAPPHGDLHAWIAAEIDTARALRTLLVEAKGLHRAQIRAAGYWRLGHADAHTKLDDEPSPDGRRSGASTSSALIGRR